MPTVEKEQGKHASAYTYSLSLAKKGFVGGGLLTKGEGLECSYRCVCVFECSGSSCKQLTKTFGSKCPALKYSSTVVYCSTSETPVSVSTQL